MSERTNRRDDSQEKKESPGFSKTVLDDITRGDFHRAMQRDLMDVYHFYVDDKAREQLDGMGQFSRWTFVIFCTLKNSILKLTPARRLLLLASIIFFLEGVFNQVNVGALIAGFLVLLFILLLELKDKLLAQDELAAGRAVQTALVPRDNPDLSGWELWLYTRPANDVGGDLVDYLPVRDGRLGIALGDVAGKGLGAALISAKLQSTIRALAPAYSDLSELGNQLNTIFCRDGLPDRFISLVYLEVEPDGEHVRILNAGHLPPVILREKGIRELPKGAPALGIMTSATYREQYTALEAGDVLLVYSDGLTEARNDKGEFFGRKRLASYLSRCRDLPAEEAGKLLLDAVDRFVGEARPSDDLSLIILKRVPVSVQRLHTGSEEPTRSVEFEGS